MVPKADVLQRLAQQVDKVPPLKRLKPDSPEFRGWHRDTEVLIEQIFGTETRHLGDFKDIDYSPSVSYGDTPDDVYQQAYCSGLDHAAAVLQSMTNEVEQYGNEPARPTASQQLGQPRREAVWPFAPTKLPETQLWVSDYRNQSPYPGLFAMFRLAFGSHLGRSSVPRFSQARRSVRHLSSENFSANHRFRHRF